MAKWSTITEFNEQYGTGNTIKNKIFIKVQNAEDCQFLVDNLASIDVPSLIFLAHNDYRQIIAKNQLFCINYSQFNELSGDVTNLETRVDNIDTYIGNLNSYIDEINSYIGNVNELESTTKIVVSAINDLYGRVGDDTVANQIQEAISSINEDISYINDDIAELQARTISVVSGDDFISVVPTEELDGENNPTGHVTYTISAVSNMLDTEIMDKINDALSLDSNQESIKVLKQLAYEIGYFKTEGIAYWENEEGVSYSVIDVIMDKLNGQMTQEEIEELLAIKLENVNINDVQGEIRDNIAYVTLDTDDLLVSYDIAREIITTGSSSNPENMSISDALQILNNNISDVIQSAGVSGIVQGDGVQLIGNAEGNVYTGNVGISTNAGLISLGEDISYISDSDTTTMSIAEALSILSEKIKTNEDIIAVHETRLETVEDDVNELKNQMSYLEWSIVEN